MQSKENMTGKGTGPGCRQKEEAHRRRWVLGLRAGDTEDGAWNRKRNPGNGPSLKGRRVV